MTRLLSGALLTCALVDPLARADEPPAHLVYPVRTALHRELAPADVMVYLDTTAVFHGGDLDALKLPVLRKALLPHKAATKVHFTLFVPKVDDTPSKVLDALQFTTIGFGHGVGFDKATVHFLNSNSPTSWADRVAPFTGKPRQPAGDEPASSADGVKAYPVRTVLSRFLTSDADCAVVIVPPLVKGTGTIPAKIKTAAVDLVAKLKLPHKKRVAFYVQHVSDGDRGSLLAEFDKLAITLGFDANTVSFR